MKTIVETITGKQVNLAAPHLDQICLEDIVFSLSRLARFNGHTDGEFVYSVAQHSVWCAMAALEFFGASYETALKVLLHDAHEAYTGDITTPLKECNFLYINPLQEKLQSLIWCQLEIVSPDREEQELIKVIDEYALAIEAFSLVKSKRRGWGLPAPPIKHYAIWQAPMPPAEAYKQMYNAYILLINHNPLKQLCA